MKQPIKALAAASETPMTDEIKPVRKFAKEIDASPKAPDVIVKVRVLKRGADKISTGRHEATLGDEFYALHEIFETTETIARELEDRDFVEILNG